MALPHRNGPPASKWPEGVLIDLRADGPRQLRDETGGGSSAVGTQALAPSACVETTAPTASPPPVTMPRRAPGTTGLKGLFPAPPGAPFVLQLYVPISYLIFLTREGARNSPISPVVPETRLERTVSRRGRSTA